MVVDDFPTGRCFPDHQCKPARRVASTCGRSFQAVLPGSQDQPRRKRPCVDLRESQHPHRIAIRIPPAIPIQNRFGSPSNNLAADEGSFRSVLIVRHKSLQVPPVPHGLRFSEHRANLIALPKQNRRRANQQYDPWRTHSCAQRRHSPETLAQALDSIVGQDCILRPIFNRPCS